MRKAIAGVLMVGAVATTACEASLGLDGASTVSFATPAESDRVSSGGHTLVITQATMTFAQVGLAGTAAAAHSGSTTVRLPVEGGIVTAAHIDAGAGVYDRVTMVVQSVRVRGTYDGAPFDVTIAGNGDAQSVTLLPPLTVTADGGGNATVRVDVREWFRSGGGIMAPATVAASAALRAEVLANVAASLVAFVDLDVNGSAG